MKVALYISLLINWLACLVSLIWMTRLQKQSIAMKIVAITMREEYIKREREFRDVYSNALMEVYNSIDLYLKNPIESEDPELKEHVEKLKKQRDNLHEYLVKLELCDLPVREHK